MSIPEWVTNGLIVWVLLVLCVVVGLVEWNAFRGGRPPTQPPEEPAGWLLQIERRSEEED